MKLPFYIKPEKKKEKSFFTYNDITNTLFFNKFPSLTVKPFKQLNHSGLQFISITFSIRLSYREVLLDRISKSIIRFNNYKVENQKEKILKLPYWIYSIILKEYEKISNNWINYYTDNIDDYCKKVEISKLNWSIIKSNLPISFIKEEPAIEQKIWVKVNQTLDKEEISEYIEQIRKSLLPWLNSDLYKELKKKEDNTRVNVNYEETREQMLKNKFEYSKEELDIIR